VTSDPGHRTRMNDPRRFGYTIASLHEEVTAHVPQGIRQVAVDAMGHHRRGPAGGDVYGRGGGFSNRSAHRRNRTTHRARHVTPPLQPVNLAGVQ
jgi:hypothetical protein